MQVDVYSPPWDVSGKYHRYKIEEGRVYYQPLQETSDWKIVSFVKDRIPAQAKADWEDLMVLDDKGNIQYTKITANMDNPEWKSGIFDLPVISEIFNRYVYEDPYPKSSGLWSPSFIEEGKIYVDHLRRKHPIDTSLAYGSTTFLLIYDERHRGFRCYDPFCFKGPEDKESFLYLPLPETADFTFELKGLATCASQSVMLGYEICPEQSGGVRKTIALYTIFADTNTMGENPLIEYTYGSNPQKEEFVLPVALYRKHCLPPGQITSCVKVLRTQGNENDDRLLEIEGMQGEQCGFWQKELSQQQWSFIPCKDHKIPSSSILSLVECDPKSEFHPSVFNYVSENGKDKLLNFGKNSLQSTIFCENGETLTLYRNQSKMNFIGFNFTDYTLVHNKDGSTESVVIDEKEGGLVIESSQIMSRKTLFEFLSTKNKMINL